MSHSPRITSRLTEKAQRGRTFALWSPSGERGTGFLLGQDCLLTASHVCVTDTVYYRGRTEDTWHEDGEIVIRDKCLDVAVIRIRSNTSPVAQIPIWFYRPDIKTRAIIKGYPAFKKEEDKKLRILDVYADCTPDVGIENDSLEALTVGNYPVQDTEWGGISGAGFVLNGALAGVVIESTRLSLVARTLEVIRTNHALWSAIEPYVTARTPDWMSTNIHNVGREIEKAPSTLLTARYEIVPFIPEIRAKELEALESWVEEPESHPLRLFVGPGGIGKTRLFIHWAQELRKRGWTAGFLENGKTFEIHESASPLFVIVDYAETRLDEIKKLLESFEDIHQEEESEDRSFYIALLARGNGDWWVKLKERHPIAQNTSIQYLNDIKLESELREQAFRKATRVFAERLQKTPQKTIPALHQAHHGQILYVLMEAYLALVQDDEDRTTATPISGAPLVLNEVLKHEQYFWLPKELEEDEDARWLFMRQANRLVAALTLRGKTNVDQLEYFDLTVNGRRSDDDWFVQFRERLISLYPHPEESDEEYVAGLEPDILGEALVAQVLWGAREYTRYRPQNYLECVFSDSNDLVTITHGFIVLGRIELTSGQEEDAQKWLEKLLRINTGVHGLAAALLAALAIGQKSASSSLGYILSRVLKEQQQTDILNRLAPLIDQVIPEQTVSLRELSTLVLEAQLATETDAEKRSQLLNSLGNRLSNLGHREEALKATQEAVEIRRSLSAHRPDAFLLDLAMSLNNLGKMLSDLGHREEALKATREAVEIRRSLSAHRPDAFLPDLAMSLNNLGNMLSDLGHREEALKATREAVEIRRCLSAHRPDAFLPDLAMSLNNLGNMLSDLGHREEALKATREAVEIRRCLSAHRLDAFLPDLAMSLNNLGNKLSDLGHREEALKATQEAVEIRRCLSAHRPDAFLPDLAMSLNNLGKMLSDLGHREEALKATREAVEIRRCLSAHRPDAFLPDLAMGLNNLGAMLSGLGHREEALKATREAVETYRCLSTHRPDAFLPDLAGSLNNLGAMLSGLGHREEALKATREAVEIRRGLSAHRPDAFLPDLAMSLSNLGNMLSDLGHREEALKATREAVETYRCLSAHRPDAFLPDLAMSLNNLGPMLSDLGHREEALKVTREAVEIRRGLSAHRLDAFLPDLTMSLNNLGAMLSDLGHREEALKATREAVETYRCLSAHRPDAFLPDLAMSLNNLGPILSDLGHREEALKATREAVEIRRSLSAHRPDAFLPDLAMSLNNLGSRLSALGHREEALKATREAVETYRCLSAHRPDAFLPDLAGSLNNLGKMLSALRHREEAFEASKESVEFYTQLFIAYPETFAQDFLISVRSFAQRIQDVGRNLESSPAMQKAIEAFTHHQELFQSPDEAS